MNNPKPLQFPPDIWVRPGMKGDRTAVTQFAFAALRKIGIEPDAQRWEANLANFGHNSDTVKEFILCSAEQVIGVGILEIRGEGLGELTDLYLHEQFRGRGLGRVFLEYLVAQAKQLGLSRLELQTRSEFEAANRMYLKAGWLRAADPKNETAADRPNRAYFLELKSEPDDLL